MDKLLNCDCVDGMKDLPDDLIDLTVTSPPYDEMRTYDLLPVPKFKQVADELFRITKPGGVVVWVVQEQIKDGSQTGTSSEQRLYFRDIGFLLWDRIVMARFGRISPQSGHYGLPMEEAFILTKGKPTNVTLWSDRRNKTYGKVRTVQARLPDGSLGRKKVKVGDNRFGVRPNLLCYATGLHVAKEDWIRQVEHGALMPEKMAEELILSYTKPDDLVFDPMAGLATTCKMALLNHRRYLGMEINESYFDFAERRMKLAQEEYKVRLFENLIERRG